jgi:hypothetical protein
MRITVNGRFLRVHGNLLGDQPADIADRQPGLEQLADFQGKVPQVRPGILSAGAGLPEQAHRDPCVVADRNGS